MRLRTVSTIFFAAVVAAVLIASPYRAHPIHALSEFVAPPPVRETVAASTTLLFVGDMFFDRYIRTMVRKHGEEHLFSCADTILMSADAVIGNLEGPITGEESKSEGTEIGSAENFRFTFPSTTAALLARHNIRIVDLGNNHIANFGSDGIRQTHRSLDEAGVRYFGGVSGDEAIFTTKINGVPLSFISYNAYYGTSSLAVAEEIKKEKAKGQTIIVFAHWGEEYSTSTSLLHDRAALFATSGASLIVGAHPHVVLPSEMIGDTPVYYSLGNFIFDQYWNDKVTHGLSLEVNIKGGTLSVSEHYVDIMRDGRSCIVRRCAKSLLTVSTSVFRTSMCTGCE
jgi:poly-gamma-glutamate synthesis protein (capsule biosynthesis protein)